MDASSCTLEEFTISEKGNTLPTPLKERRHRHWPKLRVHTLRLQLEVPSSVHLALGPVSGGEATGWGLQRRRVKDLEVSIPEGC